MAAFERGVVRRCVVFFVLSAAWAGSANVLPQLYLLAEPADERSVTLAWLLSLATLASMAGVASSRRLLQRGHRLEPASFVLGWVVMLVLLSVVVLGTVSLAGYALALCGFRLACGLLTNHLDHRLLAAAGRRAPRPTPRRSRASASWARPWVRPCSRSARRGRGGWRWRRWSSLCSCCPWPWMV